MIRANVVDSKAGALVLPKARGGGHWPHLRQKLQSPLSIWFHAEAQAVDASQGQPRPGKALRRRPLKIPEDPTIKRL